MTGNNLWSDLSFWIFKDPVDRFGRIKTQHGDLRMAQWLASVDGGRSIVARLCRRYSRHGGQQDGAGCAQRDRFFPRIQREGDRPNKSLSFRLNLCDNLIGLAFFLSIPTASSRYRDSSTSGGSSTMAVYWCCYHSCCASTARGAIARCASSPLPSSRTIQFRWRRISRRRFTIYVSTPRSKWSKWLVHSINQPIDKKVLHLTFVFSRSIHIV